MPRSLHLDARHGLTLEAFVAAVVDLGIAPSPILFAAGSLGLDGELRFEREAAGTRLALLPGPTAATRPYPEAARLLESSGIQPESARNATRLLHGIGEARAAADSIPLELIEFADAAPQDSLLAIAAAGHALACIGPTRWTGSRVNVGSTLPTGALAELLAPYADHLDFEEPSAGVTLGGAALVALHIPLSLCGQRDPAWHGFAPRGRGLLPQGDLPLVIDLGDAAP